MSYKLRIFEWNYSGDIESQPDSLLDKIKNQLGLDKTVSKEQPVGQLMREYQCPEDIPAPQDTDPFKYGVDRVKELYNI